MDNQLLKWISAIQAISQNGLTYSTNPFDIERFDQLALIAQKMAAYFSDKPIDDVKHFFSIEKGYATPKLDVRAFILKQDKLLLVKERSDGLWSLPGGWVDVNDSPSDAVIKEAREETGFNVKVIRLLALWDNLKHEHPRHWPHIHKIVFLCEIISGEMKENIEISEINFFPLNNLPELSTPRVTNSQIKRLYKLVLNNDITDFD